MFKNKKPDNYRFGALLQTYQTWEFKNIIYILDLMLINDFSSLRLISLFSNSAQILSSPVCSWNLFPIHCLLKLLQITIYFLRTHYLSYLIHDWDQLILLWMFLTGEQCLDNTRKGWSESISPYRSSKYFFIISSILCCITNSS